MGPHLRQTLPVCEIVQHGKQGKVSERAAMSPTGTMTSAFASDAELRQQFVAEGWSAKARYLRAVAALGLLFIPLGWLTDLAVLGPSVLAFALLGPRLLTAATMLPLLVASWSPRRPAYLPAAHALVAFGVPAGHTLIFTLKPSNVSAQGGAMVFLWAVFALGLQSSVRGKIVAGAAGLALYCVHLAYLAHATGGAYVDPTRAAPVLLLAAIAVFVLPWWPERIEEQGLREYVARRRFEHELALRETREAALAVAEAAARVAEQGALEQKERADRAAELARHEAATRAALFADMSHELRTPMSGIQGVVDLLRGTPLDAEQASYLETIRASNQSLLALLNDVIDFTRIEEGRLPLAPTSAPLIETLRAPLEALRASAERKGLALRFVAAEGLPEYVRLDPARVQQVVVHLVENAIRFTAQGSVALRATVSEVQERRGTLRVEVEDTGRGMSRAQQERLSQRIGPADRDAARRAGGSGLGLPICKGLVELMGGAIGVDSELGRGSRFWFEVPIEVSGAPREDEADAEVPTLRVLLAEDNPVNQMILSLMLKKLGQAVTVASDGKQALDLLHAHGFAFDLAILDMQMPEMNGDEVARRLRASGGAAAAAMVVVALTAGVSADEQRRHERAGIDGFYTKPIELAELRRMLIRSKKGRAAA